MSEQPDHELEVLEDDQNVPPRPEEAIADATRSPQPQSPPSPESAATPPRPSGADDEPARS